MLEIIEGPMGSFKSYQSVVRIVNEIVRGGVVATNVHIKRKELIECLKTRFAWSMRDDQLLELEGSHINEFYKYTPAGTPDCRVLIIIEEAGRYFNSRDWASVNRKVLDFLALSRHEYNDLVMIDQSSSNIDKQFRRLTDFYWRTRAVNHIAGLGWWPFRNYIVGQVDRDGKTLARQDMYYARSWVFDIYDSYSKNVASFDRMKMEVRRHDGKIKKSKGWYMKTLLIFGILCMSVSFGVKYHMKNKNEKKDVQKAGQVVMPAIRTEMISTVIVEKAVEEKLLEKKEESKARGIVRYGKNWYAIIDGKILRPGDTYKDKKLLIVQNVGYQWGMNDGRVYFEPY